MTPAQVIKHFGGQVAAARALGLAQPSVAAWKRKGRISYLRQLQIQEVTGGKLKADGKK